MIEITNVPPKIKGIFSVKNSVFTWIYNKYNIEAGVIKPQGSTTIINF